MTGRQRRSRRTDTPLPYTTLSRSLARPLNLQKLEPGQEAFRVIMRFCSFGCNFVPEFFQKGTFKPQHALIADQPVRSEEHTSDLQSLMHSPYAVFCCE